MKIVKRFDFKARLSVHLTEMYKITDDKDRYFIVANETYKNKSFIVMSLNKAKDMAIAAGDIQFADSIGGAIEQISQKVSEKYRKIRGQR